MSRNTQYNRADVTVVLDGDLVEGFGEGDAIRIIPNEAGATITDGLDSSTISFNSIKSGQVEIDLKPTSKTLEKITKLHSSQKTSNARTFDIEVSTGVGEFHSCKRCAILNIGTITTGGETLQSRTVVMLCEEIELDEAS